MEPTKEDFNYFKECCQEYIAKYELHDWTFRFHFKDKNEKGNDKQSAWIKRNPSNLQADIYLDDKYDFESKEEIKKAAKHEILHCLIGELYLAGIQREMDFDEVDRLEEKLVHKLEYLL